MTVAIDHVASDRAARKRIEQGLRMLTVPLPHLAGLAAAVRVDLDGRVPTMGIFASGRLLANPGFVARLKDNELVFVLAHELLHLALRTHDRARGSGRLEFNYAHDYIINDVLRVELGFTAIPAGGLDMPGARARSAEEIVLEMRRNADLMPSRSQVFEGAQTSVRAVFGDRSKQGPNDKAGDVLTDGTEREMFPADAEDLARRKAAIGEIAARGLALAAAMGAMKNRGTAPGTMSTTMSAQRPNAQPAWHRALQKWIESVSPGQRTFTRPSRRGERTDLVLPGRKRESWMLNVVLDTSGSMNEEIPLALGAIGSFCDAAGVDRVRIMQCDVAVTADDLVSPEELSTFNVRGLGGSDLSPAMLSLADDPQVTATAIVTDGDVTFPASAMPYGILWVLPARGGAAFNPPYGQVIAMDRNRL